MKDTTVLVKQRARGPWRQAKVLKSYLVRERMIRTEDGLLYRSLLFKGPDGTTYRYPWQYYGTGSAEWLKERYEDCISHRKNTRIKI